MRRVLSLWQPWATLCISRHPRTNKVAKEIETRAYCPGRYYVNPPFEVVIHATKGFTAEQFRFSDEILPRRALLDRGYFPGSPARAHRHELKPLPLGQIIGTATVKECISTVSALELLELSVEERTLGLYTPGRFAWILGDQRELPTPIPFKGKQQILWELPAEVNAEVDRQLGLTLATSPVVAQNSHD